MRKIGLVFFLLNSVALVAEVPLIPRTVLFGNPDKMSVHISPDGTHLAYIAPCDGVLNIWLRTIGCTDDHPVTHDTKRGIHTFSWAEDNLHILFKKDTDGDENWHLYALNSQSEEVRDLTPFDQVQAHLLHSDSDRPHELLITLNKDDKKLFDLYHLDLLTGELTLWERNPGAVIGWLVDWDFVVRGRVSMLPDGGNLFEVRATKEAEWINFMRWSFEDASSSGPLSFSRDGLSVYLLDATGREAACLVKADLATGEKKMIADGGAYDLSATLFDTHTGDPLCVAFYRDRLEWEILNDVIADDFTRILGTDKGDLVGVRRTLDGTRWILVFAHDNAPAAYYLYDQTTKNMQFLFYNQAELNEYPLVPMQPLQIVARDGLILHGYLTLPQESSAKPVPLVLNVHGGPWARDTWGYDPEAQWFANRGYACLQVNFRGSTGYGKAFVHAGNREWGGKMQDDLVDAVNWAIGQGIADPKKIAIYGWSYGGYAALVGATFTPDLFCCAVDGVGPSNLITLLNSIPPYWEVTRAHFTKCIGDPVCDELFLKERSPLFKVDCIKIPIFVVQGAHDPRVKQAEADQMVAAMRAHGLSCEYLLFPDEGHGCARPENRIIFYEAAERFLAQHLGGRSEEAK